MNQPDGPDDPGGGDGKPPSGPLDDAEALVLSPEDLPPGLADAIQEAVNNIAVITIVDHGFLVKQARVAGWDAKRLRELYPFLPVWVRKDLLNQRLALDVHGQLHVLH